MSIRLSYPQLAAILFLAFTAPATLVAQTDVPKQNSTASGVLVTDGGNRVIYTAEYFKQYSAVTARDQLQRVPGVQDLLGNGRGGGDARGFGSAGDQILINGGRISGKSNDVDSVLERIQARQVVQIEIIRGSVPGLDVRSQGRVVNVVLQDSIDTGYGSLSTGLTRYPDHKWGGNGEATYSSTLGGMSYLLSLEGRLGRRIEVSDDRFYTRAGNLFGRETENASREFNAYTLSANTSYDFANGSTLNLNGQFVRDDDSDNELSTGYLLTDGIETPDGSRLREEGNPGDSWEIGGDYRYRLDNGNTLTTRFIYTYDSGTEHGSFYHIPIGESAQLDELQIEESKSSEKILRSAYEWQLGEKHAFESGLEIAINTSEEDTRLFEEDSGKLVEITLFNQQSDIKETRYEIFNSYTWQVSNQLLLESSLDLEYSQIEQQGGDVSRVRDFIYPKPRLALSYDLNEQVQIRGRIERTVGQLDFGDFVSSFVNDDNRSDVISAGNPELEPEKAWEYELTYEHQFLNDLGVFSVTALYADISDHLANVPLVIDTNKGSEIRTAPGNLGDGYNAEVEFSSSLRLDWLNIPGGVLDLSVEIERSRITDPFTGEQRPLDYSETYNWTLAYRQDLNWWGFSYGFEARNQAMSPEYDLDYWQERDDGQELEVFAEFQPLPSLTLRFEAENLLGAEEQRVRYQYTGNRADNILARREERSSDPGREFSVSAQWVF